MSSTTIASLLYANQQIILYTGIPTLIVGLVGNVLSMIVFLSLRTFRQSSCALYLTVLSFVDMLQLLTGLFSRIMISGFGMDWTQRSLFYCKARTFAFQLSASISLTCLVLATIDQYFATCSPPRHPHWCTIKLARRIVFVVLLVFFLEQIPCLIFYDHVLLPKSNTTICDITNVNFTTFNAYVNYLILGNLLPHSMAFSCALLAYRNIKQIPYRTVPLVRRELDKQLSNMVLFQVAFTVVTAVPNLVIYLILSYAYIPDPVVSAQLRLTYAISVSLFYTRFAVSMHWNRLLSCKLSCTRHVFL